MLAIHFKLASTARSESIEPPFFNAAARRCSIRRARYVSGSRDGVRIEFVELGLASSGRRIWSGKSAPVEGREAINDSRAETEFADADGLERDGTVGSISASGDVLLPERVNFPVRRSPVFVAAVDAGELPVSAMSAGAGLGLVRRRIMSFAGAPTSFGTDASGERSVGSVSTAPSSIKGAARSAAPRCGSTRDDTSICEVSRAICCRVAEAAMRVSGRASGVGSSISRD